MPIANKSYHLHILNASEPKSTLPGEIIASKRDERLATTLEVADRLNATVGNLIEYKAKKATF